MSAQATWRLSPQHSRVEHPRQPRPTRGRSPCDVPSRPSPTRSSHSVQTRLGTGRSLVGWWRLLSGESVLRGAVSSLPLLLASFPMPRRLLTWASPPTLWSVHSSLRELFIEAETLAAGSGPWCPSLCQGWGGDNTQTHGPK